MENYGGIVEKLDEWVEEHINDLVDFVCKLIRVDTSVPPGKNYDKIAEMIADKLNEVGIKAELHEIPEKLLMEKMKEDGITDISGPRTNVVAYLEGKERKPKVLTNGHTDVVPARPDKWSVDPFKGVVKNGRIYGRGSSDMKGSLGAMIYSMWAFKDLNIKLNGDIVATFTTDEELGGYTGIRYFIDKGIINKDMDYCISTDGTIEEINIADLGDVEVVITVWGKPYHSGTGWRGVNAIEHAASLINRLVELGKKIGERRSKIPIKPIDDVKYMRPGLYVNVIEGGLKPNIIPYKCTIIVDRRMIPEENLEDSLEEIREVINKYVKEHPEVSIDMHHRAYYPPGALDPDHPLVKIVKEVTKEVLGEELLAVGGQGSTDVAFIGALGIPTVCIGVGREESNAHGVDENIRIEDLKALTKILIRCYVRLLGVADT